MIHFWTVLLCFTCIDGAVPLTKKQVSGKGFHFKGLEARIFLGTKATSKQFPWQAGIFHENFNPKNFWCGGSLIDNQWILTAAHCVVKFFDPSEHSKFVKFTKSVNLAVFLGSTSLVKNSNLENDNRVEFSSNLKAYVHPNVSFPNNNESWPISEMRWPSNDIALIKLPTPVTPNDNIQPIRLTTEKPGVGSKVVASGWGMTTEGYETSKDLLFARMTTITNDICEHRATDYLCINGDQQTCQRDSGGPLVYYNETSKTYFLVGVTGAGVRTVDEHKDDPTCKYYKFDLSLNVFKFKGWINEIMKEHSH